MNVFDFLAHLKASDIQVSAEDGKLRINAPKGAITPEIKAELAVRKAEILSLFSEPELLTPVRAAGEAQLSLAQEHLWQLHRLTPATLAYNMHAIFRLRGPLEVPALETAICEVVERHEILRASFPGSNDHKPELFVAPASSITLNQVNLPSTVNAAELQSIIESEIRFPFDLSHGPLFRPTVLRIDSEDHVLVLVMHHIISDGQSFGILLRDLEQAYRAARENTKPDWKSSSLQYVDYAAWQRKWLESDASAADRGFWQAQLAGTVPALEIPFDHPHPVQTSADGDFVEFQMDSLSAPLQELCRREGVTLFAVVLAAFNTVLHRYTGQRDLLVCTPVAGRDRMEFSDLIGYFNNTLLLRTDLTKSNTLRDLLQQTQSLVLSALAHQMFPFREAAGFAGVARTPLSRAMVVVQNADDLALRRPGLTAEKVVAFNQAVQYDLALEVTVTSAQLSGRLMYRKVLFERATIEKLASEWTGVLCEFLEQPENPVSRAGPEQLTAKANRLHQTRPDYVAPRNDLERRLAQIWQDVLGIEKVGIHDGFFELGGHSLLALRLFTRIEQETGTNLPLSTLLQTTTIAHMAQIISGEAQDGSWDCLVPIQTTGSKAPFFCVHGIGGGVIGYRDIASFLGDVQPFYGLQAVGQDGSVPYDQSIEAMASRYIDVMRAQQPQGPYRIGGYCFGGVVAYEMACQLEKIGEEVSLLAIFEGAMADALDARGSVTDRARAVWSNLPTWVKDYSSMSPAQLVNRMRSTANKIWIKFQRNPETQRRVRVEETLDINVDDLPQRNVELTDLHLNAALQYRPAKYRGTVTLFRARNRSVNEILFGSLDPKMGWGAFANGGVRVILVDGFHRNMHLNPYAESLARGLTKELNRAAKAEFAARNERREGS